MINADVLSRLSPDLADAILTRIARDPILRYKTLRDSRGQAGFIAATAGGAHGVYLISGGNRTGKSESGAFAFARRALFELRKVDGGPTPILWAIARTYEDSGEIQWKQKLSKFIPPDSIADIAWRDRTKQWPAMVRLKNGVEIWFKASEQGREAFQGNAIAGAWFDEQFPWDIFEETQTRCIDYMAPIFVTFTPLEPDPEMESRFIEPPPGWHWFSIDFEENRKSRGGYLEDQIVDKQLAEWRVLPTYYARKSGQFIGLEGAVYPIFSRQVHVADFGAEDLDPRWWRGCGIDFGYRNPFACIWGAQDDEGDWWIYAEHQVGGQSIEWHAGQIDQINHATAQARPWLTPMVPTAPEAYYADPGGDTMPTGRGVDDFKTSGRRKLAELGYHVTNANKDLMRGIEHVLWLMQTDETMRPRIHISSRCPILIRQLMGYRWEKTQSTLRDPPERTAKLNDHGPDALRYLVWTRHRLTGGTSQADRLSTQYRSGAVVPGARPIGKGYTTNPMLGGRKRP